MATYTNIVITYVGNNIWGFTDNTMSSGKYKAASANSGFVDGDLITFKTKTGGIIYDRQPYNIFTYIDMTDSGNNFTPTSAINLESQLQAFGFFGESNGGGSGDIAFTDLTDTFSVLAGRENQFLVVNEDGTLITTLDATIPVSITDLIDTPDEIVPFYFLMGNGNGTAYINVDANLFVRPVADAGMTWLKKGYHWETNSLGNFVVFNNAPEEEIGDYYYGTMFNDPFDSQSGVITIPLARWNGGEKIYKESFTYASYQILAFDDEPDF